MNIYDARGMLIGVLGIGRDITEHKQAEEKIRQMAYHDSLTGLPNRKLFSDRLGIALVQAQRNRMEVGVAMLDLDNFKDVNDTLGHEGGDLLLKAAAERLSVALRKGCQGDDLYGAQPEFEDYCRRCGDRRAVVLPAGTRIRRNPGLLVQLAFAVRGDPGDFGERISLVQEVSMATGIREILKGRTSSWRPLYFCSRCGEIYVPPPTIEEIEKNKGVLYNLKVVEVCLGFFREKGFKFE